MSYDNAYYRGIYIYALFKQITYLQSVLPNQDKIMWHFIRVYTVKVKKISRQCFYFNLTPLDMYNGLSQHANVVV